MPGGGHFGDTVGAMNVSKAIGRHVHPHMLRHTYGDTLGMVTDVPTVQALMRHKHLSSTEKYQHVNGQRETAAIQKMEALHLQEAQP